MDIYSLYRFFWDFSFENPHKVKPTHVAIYSFAIEHNNRLGWKQIFGFPTSMAMEATGIKSYTVFKKHLDDLVEWGFFIMHERSKNQYSSNMIALKENAKATSKANDKALDKALSKHNTKHTSKQVQSIDQSSSESTVSINKQDYNSTTLQPYVRSARENSYTYPSSDTDTELTEFFTNNGSTPEDAKRFYNHYASQGWVKPNGQPIAMWEAAAKSWIDKTLHDPKFKPTQNESDYTKYQKQYNW
jgi:hypothetical protein